MHFWTTTLTDMSWGLMQHIDARALARRIRIHALRMTNTGGGAHIGSIFSCADILAVLYGGVLTLDPTDPASAGRDRFVLSKGHAGGGLYAALAERGFFAVEKLLTHYQDGSDLCGHVSHQLPGVDVSTGALGHGLSIATGMAYAGKLRDREHRVFCLLSDGECDEGSIWEAALFAAHHRLTNLAVIVDYNRIQGIAPISEVIGLEPFADKWTAFGWSVREVDGHDHETLKAALAVVPLRGGKPACLIAHTTKGKGVSFMENTVLWHYRIPRGAEYEAALAELEDLS
jgi:transketolase